MAEDKNKMKLILSSAPHVRVGYSVKSIMWLVVFALIPAASYGVYLNGIDAFMVIAVCVGFSVLAEFLIRVLLKRPGTVQNGSAVITGLLLAMNLPPHFPLWMAAVGSVFAIVIVKEIFGGLGFNIWNPALAARAFLMASWPGHMTSNWHHFSETNILSSSLQNPGVPDKAFSVITGATPLGALKEGAYKLAESGFNVMTGASPAAALKEGASKLTDSGADVVNIHSVLYSNSMLKSLFMGDVGGCIGETSVLFLLVGALILLAVGIISWHIPFSYIGSFAAVITAYNFATGSPEPVRALLFHIFSGGLIIGAFFMATDMVTSPVTKRGMLIFGAGCGIVAAAIRIWGGYPEGVSYSILFMNTCVPLIDRFTKNRVYGKR